MNCKDCGKFIHVTSPNRPDQCQACSIKPELVQVILRDKSTTYIRRGRYEIWDMLVSYNEDGTPRTQQTYPDPNSHVVIVHPLNIMALVPLIPTELNLWKEQANG